MKRTLPLAIGITLAMTTAVYVLLAVVAVLTATPGELAASRAPLAFLYERRRDPRRRGLRSWAFLRS